MSEIHRVYRIPGRDLAQMDLSFVEDEIPHVDLEIVKSIAESFVKHGQIQALIIKGRVLIHGLRRYLAAKMIQEGFEDRWGNYYCDPQFGLTAYEIRSNLELVRFWRNQTKIYHQVSIETPD